MALACNTNKNDPIISSGSSVDCAIDSAATSDLADNGVNFANNGSASANNSSFDFVNNALDFADNDFTLWNISSNSHVDGRDVFDFGAACADLGLTKDLSRRPTTPATTYSGQSSLTRLTDTIQPSTPATTYSSEYAVFDFDTAWTDLGLTTDVSQSSPTSLSNTMSSSTPATAYSSENAAFDFEAACAALGLPTTPTAPLLPEPAPTPTTPRRCGTYSSEPAIQSPTPTRARNASVALENLVGRATKTTLPVPRLSTRKRTAVEAFVATATKQESPVPVIKKARKATKPFGILV